MAVYNRCYSSKSSLAKATAAHVDIEGYFLCITSSRGDRAYPEDSVIIYTSDHGDYMGYHHMMLKENYMHDPLVKVPLIIKYPYHDKKKSVSNILVSNIDLAPTILVSLNPKVHAIQNWKEAGYVTGLIGKNHCFELKDDLELFDVLCEISSGGLEKGNNKAANLTFPNIKNEMRQKLLDWSIMTEDARPVPLPW